jgi:ribosome recycling factor
MSLITAKLLFRNTTGSRRLLLPTGSQHRFLLATTTSSLPTASVAMMEQQRSVSSFSRQMVISSNDSHCQFPQRQQQQQLQLRWRHSSKIGHMKETLDELAHRPEREAAQERRQKKKEKATAKRPKKKGDETPAAAAAKTPVADIMVDDAEGGLDFLNDDYEDDDHHDDDDDDDDREQEDEDAEPSLPDLNKVETKMMNYIARFQESLKSIRGAEPTAEMFDDIQVLAYGSPTPLKAVGQVVIVSPTLAQITCFDPSIAKDVLKAIQLSLDQLNPQLEDGGNIKVPLPRVSMEIREQTAKLLKKKAEATKQRIRQVRRKTMDVVKQGKDGKLTGISKDDAFASGKEIDTLTETVTERLQKLVDEKTDSIMAL